MKTTKEINIKMKTTSSSERSSRLLGHVKLLYFSVRILDGCSVVQLADSCLCSLPISVRGNSRSPDIGTASAFQQKCLSSHDL